MRIIIDTDICGDCDDVGALTIANHLMSAGKAEIVAVTQCTHAEFGASCIHAINDVYGHSSIPVGKTTRRCKTADLCGADGCTVYNKAVSETYYNGSYPASGEAIDTLRKALASSDEKVTIITIGELTNIDDLLNSKPDANSPLTGIELVKQKADRIVMMAGCFDGRDGDSFAEWNVRADANAAAGVAKNSPVPLVFCGFEIGDTVITGTCLQTLDKNHPSRMGYDLFGCPDGRCSWDLVTVAYAVLGTCDGLWKERTGYTVSFDSVGIQTYKQDGGNHTLLQNAADGAAIAKRLDELLMGVNI